jgi:hypothetical protein
MDATIRSDALSPHPDPLPQGEGNRKGRGVRRFLRGRGRKPTEPAAAGLMLPLPTSHKPQATSREPANAAPDNPNEPNEPNELGSLRGLCVLCALREKREQKNASHPRRARAATSTGYKLQATSCSTANAAPDNPNEPNELGSLRGLCALCALCERREQNSVSHRRRARAATPTGYKLQATSREPANRERLARHEHRGAACASLQSVAGWEQRRKRSDPSPRCEANEPY